MVETIARVVVIALLISITIGFLGAAVFSWELNTSAYLQGLTSLLHIAYYILPIAKLSPIIITFVSLMSLRIIVAFVKTLWSLLPIKG